MILKKDTDYLQELLRDAKQIVIVQADNPDGDSLASALALESILGDMGLEPILYCGVDMPNHLKYLPGWDRVSQELPNVFDASIIVDTSALSLLEKLQESGKLTAISKRPCIVLDHHAVENTLTFAKLMINYPAVSTGEIIYELAKLLDWPLHEQANDAIAVSILSDSLGLTTSATTARSIHIIAELVDAGVNLPRLETARRDMSRKTPALVHYKGELLQRIEYHEDDRIATIDIPWQEIERYSPIYNPSVLALDEMRLTENTAVAIAFKIYKDGKVTGKIRCNYGTPIANQLANVFGGGGHVYASGFKVTKQASFSELKKECIATALSLIEALQDPQPDATI